METNKAALLASLYSKLEASDDLSAAERDVLAAAAGERKVVPAKHDIVSQGSRPEQSTLIVSGLSARYTDLRDGARRISGLHVAGDFVDLHSLLLKPMDHGILAMSECTVVAFPHEGLRRITEEHPHLTRVLWRSTLIDAAIHRQWLVAKGGLDSLGEAAHLLCELFLRHKAAGLVQGDSFTLAMTQQDFGDALGKSIVQTNRSIQTLRKLGLIAWKGQQVSVLDWEQLADLAEFDATYLRLGHGLGY